MILPFTRHIHVDQVLGISLKGILESGQGYRFSKGIIIRKSWIPGRVLGLKLLFWATLWTKVAWMYGFQYGRDWSPLSNIRSTRFCEVKLKNYVRSRSGRDVIAILWSRIEHDLILSLPLPFKLTLILFIFRQRQQQA